MAETEKKQLLTLENKNRLTVNGVKDVRSFSEDYLEFLTTLGFIGVEGDNLKIEELRQDEEKILITGEISGIFYKNQKAAKSIFGNIFK